MSVCLSHYLKASSSTPRCRLQSGHSSKKRSGDEIPTPHRGGGISWIEGDPLSWLAAPCSEWSRHVLGSPCEKCNGTDVDSTPPSTLVSIGSRIKSGDCDAIVVSYRNASSWHDLAEAWCRECLCLHLIEWPLNLGWKAVRPVPSSSKKITLKSPAKT